MKKTIKKILDISVIVGIFVASFIIPTNISVYADDNSTKLVIQSNSNTISVDDEDTNKLVYKIGETIVGYAKVSLNNNYITPVMNNNKPEFTLTKWTGSDYPVDVEIIRVPGYNPSPSYFYVDQAHSDSFPGDGALHLNIIQNNIHTLEFNFEASGGNNNNQPQQPTSDLIRIDFTINNESFTDVSVMDEIVVSDEFNFDTLENFYITRIYAPEFDENGELEDHTYTYAPGEYSYELLDNQNRHILETHFIKKGENYAKLSLIDSHTNDILETDLIQPRDKYFALKIERIMLVKNSFKGVKISTNLKPDNYDFTEWNGTDLVGTTINDPGIVTAYYGEDTINFDSGLVNPIEKIELVEGRGVPASAVEINNTSGTIRVLSNYYNEILVKVELQDGTFGYVNINRIGIFIGDLNKGQVTFYHGAGAQIENNLNVETNKQRIVAVFYHENTTTYNDYDLIVNITYIDGTKEIKIARGVGDIPNSSGPITGSDYILYSGESIGDIESVSVTAIRKGATSDATTFGGATFGSGSGVVWENRR